MTNPPSNIKRNRSARPFADLVGPTLADALKARGFATADIIGHWPDIVGARLAEHSQPMKIQWPPRPKTQGPEAPPAPATLFLRVESAFALEVEMSAAQIVERINGVFGWRCVGKLRLRQGPVEHIERRERPGVPVLAPGAAKKLDADLAGIENPGLREALERLGRQVRGQKAGSKRVTPA
jgi:hypothetical protein